MHLAKFLILYNAALDERRETILGMLEGGTPMDIGGFSCMINLQGQLQSLKEVRTLMQEILDKEKSQEEKNESDNIGDV